MKMKKPELNRLSISIVVPCRNERREIGRFLESLVRQDFAGTDWEVIIADGMSDDGTREMLHDLERTRPRIRVIDNPEKITPTGLNSAILAAKGEIILRMDAHTEYAPDYVRTCVETLISRDVDNVGGPARTRAEGLVQRAVAAAYHSSFACGGARFHQEDYEGPVDTVPYGCWRKATLERLGLFDPELVRNQDDELNLRLLRRGGAIWQSPAIKSWYSPRSDLRSLFRQYFQYGFWKLRVIAKYKVPASWRHLVPGAFVFATVFSGLFMIVARLLGQLQIARGLQALFVIIVGSYLMGLLSFSVLTARRHTWELLPYLPLVFATYHVSYGAGFLTAGLYSVRSMFAPAPPSKPFSEITR